VRFPLAYRFDPGTEDDGVTLLVPLPALNQVPLAPCDWLVPGLLEEKIAALIKGLPQSIRRAFVPVPEFARAAAAVLASGKSGVGSGENRSTPTIHSPLPTLQDALADFLTRTTGQTIPRDAWRPEALPPHLTMNYRVLDPGNRVLAEGRDLAALRRQMGGQASESLRQAAAPGEREDIAHWDFGDLPERVEIKSGDRPVAAFPTLVEEAGGLKLRSGDVRLETLFEELHEDFRAQAADKEIDLVFDMSPKLPVLKGDRDRIVLTLHNLVGNALKYTPAGGRVQVRVLETEDSLRVDVVDNGIGIKPDEHEMVFERFYRAKDNRIGGIAGSGLGLALARQVARLHGGDITLTSQIDKGSTFSLVLPLTRESVRAAA